MSVAKSHPFLWERLFGLKSGERSIQEAGARHTDSSGRRSVLWAPHSHPVQVCKAEATVNTQAKQTARAEASGGKRRTRRDSLALAGVAQWIEHGL